MRKLAALLVVMGMAVSAVAQDEVDDTGYESGDAKIGSGWGFNIQVATVGFVLGGMYNYKLAPNTMLTTSLDMFWVNGKDEQQVYNPITGFYETLNSESILMTPLSFSIKRRLLADAVSNTFRPFVMVGAGGIFGWYIGGDISKKKLNQSYSDFKTTQFAPTGVVGVGIDLGKPGLTNYGFDVKYQVVRYNGHLGVRRRFDNVQVGFHVNFY